MLNGDRFIVYGGTANHSLDSKVLKLVNHITHLNLRFSDWLPNIWHDGEQGFRLKEPESVRDRHALIFACPVSEKHEGILRDLATACKKQYKAKSVTVILSFLRYRRQDRSELNHEITRLRWFISDMKHWGVDRLVICEPHSVEKTMLYCQEFGLSLHLADPTRIFADTMTGVIQTLGGSNDIVIYSPDLGSIKRAIALARAINSRVLVTPKRRKDGRIELLNEAEFLALIPQEYGSDVEISCDRNIINGLHVIMREDEIDSGTTSATTAIKLRESGAKSVSLIATHPVCSREWAIKLFPHNKGEAPFTTVWLGNTRPRGESQRDYEGLTEYGVVEVDIAPAIAETLIKVLENITD